MDQWGKAMGTNPTKETLDMGSLGWGGGRAAEAECLVTSWIWIKAGSGVVPSWPIR